jgi:pSer/pThr/pTyr-binding forkhead associated (FHA) protein
MGSMTSVTYEPLAPSLALEGATERFDPIACLDQRVVRAAVRREALASGHYLEVHGDGRSLLIALDAGPLHVGRGLSADLRLDDMSVSRRHAILIVGAERARILDDRSSNGTFVNGRAVQQAELCDGDVIALGRVELRYLEIAQSAAA